MNKIRPSLRIFAIALFAIACIPLAGCANDPNLVSDVLGTLVDTGITATQGAEVYAAVEKNNNGQPVSLSSVLGDIGTADAALPQVQSAATTLIAQVNKDIADAKSQNAPTPAIVTATTATIVAGQDQLQAVAPASAPATTLYRFHRDAKTHRVEVCAITPAHALWHPAKV